MKQYVLTSDNFEGQVSLTYNDDGLLVNYDNASDMTYTQQRIWLEGRLFPINLERLKELDKTAVSLTVTEVTKAIDFEAFWEAYKLRDGSKVKASATWAKMPVSEQIAALRFIRTYDSQLARSGVAKCHAATYLNQKRWIR